MSHLLGAPVAVLHSPTLELAEFEYLTKVGGRKYLLVSRSWMGSSTRCRMGERETNHERFYDGRQRLNSPSVSQLAEKLPPHLVDKILRPLDAKTGSIERGEVQFDGIKAVEWSKSFVFVRYGVIPSAHVAQTTKTLRFYTHRHVMRCLALTELRPGVEPSVLLVYEYRRSRGESLPMCPSGGEDLPTLLDVLAAELKDETGSELNSGCQVYDLGKHFTDDGVSSDPINLLVVTGLQHVAGYTNPGEGISEVVAMPWTEFLDWVRTPDCRDMYAKIFATAVSLNVPKGEVFIQWPNQRIM